jgi:hypothetical protein
MRTLLVNDVVWRVSAVSFLLLDRETGRTAVRAGAVFLNVAGESLFCAMDPAPTQSAIDAMDQRLLEEFLQLARFTP